MESLTVLQSSPLLYPYIKNYWFLKVNSAFPIMERTIPTGCVELVFHRGKKLFSTLTGNFQPLSFISGQATTFSDVSTTENLDMMVVVFKPFAVKAFLPYSINDFRQKNIPIDDTGDLQLIETGKKITGNYDDIDCIHIVENFLLGRLASIGNLNFKRMHKAVVEIEKNSSLKIRNLASTLCLSYKQFNRVFNEYIGLSPKEFSRVIRFQKTLDCLQKKYPVSVTQLTYECGYFDQAHLIKDFKLFSGYTPTEFLATCSPYSDYFN